MRRFPRIPFHLRTREDRGIGPDYVVRDLSRGGAGLEVEAPVAPRYLRAGQAALLEVWLQEGLLALHGEVAWVYAPEDSDLGIAPALGLRFGQLRQDLAARLDALLALRILVPANVRSRL